MSLNLEPKVQGLLSCFGRMERDLGPPGGRTLPSGPDRSRLSESALDTPIWT